MWEPIAGGNIAQLKEQMEVNHIEMEAKQNQLGVKQQELETKMESMQTSFNALQSTFDREFKWIKKHLDHGGEAASNDNPTIDPRYKGVWPRPSGSNGGFYQPTATPTLPNNFKQPRYEFPTFDGEDDVIDWLQQCDCFFFINDTPMHQQVSTMSLYLKGKQWKSTRVDSKI